MNVQTDCSHLGLIILTEIIIFKQTSSHQLLDLCQRQSNRSPRSWKTLGTE